DAQSARAVAAAACAALGMALHAVRAADLPTAAADREALRGLWEREARLENSAAIVCIDDRDDHDTLRAVLSFVESSRSPTTGSAREPLRSSRPDAVRFFVERPTMAEQREAWVEALGPLTGRVNGQIDRMVSHFSLGRAVIHAVVDRSLAAGDEA